MTSVRIYSPAKTAMQSGKAKTSNWLLEGLPSTRKEPEPVMGWTAAGDTTGQIRLTFPSMQEAVRFATARGWDYIVTPAQGRRITPRSYVDNFKYIPPAEENV